MSEMFIKMPASQKFLILIAIVALLGLGYYFFFDSKKVTELAQQQQVLKEKEDSLKKLRAVETEMDKLKKNLETIKLKLNEAKKQLPTETEMEKLILKLGELGENNGITFRDIDPKGESPGQGNLFTKVNLGLKFQGNYRFVMGFFWNVSQLPRIINFEGVDISTSKGGRGGSSDIQVKCTAVTYKFKGE